MVLAARSISDNRRMAGSSSLMAAPVGSILFRSDQEVVERRPLSDLLLEFDGLGGEVDIGQQAYGRLEFVDGRHGGQHSLDLARGLGTEDFREDGIDNHEWSRYGGKSAVTILLC